MIDYFGTTTKRKKIVVVVVVVIVVVVVHVIAYHDSVCVSPCTLQATATASSHYWPHSATPPPHLSAEHVETKLRGLALLNRVRVSEFFKDFDPLRSGKITSMHAHNTILWY